MLKNHVNFSSENNLVSEAIRDFNEYLNNNPSIFLKYLCSGIDKVLSSPKKEYSLFMIPDGNARAAMLNLLVKEIGSNFNDSNWDISLKKIGKIIKNRLKNPDEYINAIREEYRQNGFAASLVGRELSKFSFGDSVICVYNEINVKDRSYFDIFEKTINQIATPNIKMLKDNGINAYVVGFDAEKWADKVEGLKELDSKPKKK